MENQAIIKKIDDYIKRCCEILDGVHYRYMEPTFIPFQDFIALKASVISFLNKINVDKIYVENISNFNHQAPYEVEAICNFLEEIKSDLLDNDIEEIKTVNPSKRKKYDVFISHATLDNSSFVDDLYEELSKLGIEIFYDKKTIEWGDDWEIEIINGLSKCEFAIVVLSENFFGREWTEKELNFLLERKNALGQKLILPILYKVNIENLKEKYSKIAQIQCIEANISSSKDIAIAFAKLLIKRLKGIEE